MVELNETSIHNVSSSSAERAFVAIPSKFLAIRTVSSEDFEDKLISALRKDVAVSISLQKSYQLLERIQVDASRHSLENSKFLAMQVALDFGGDHTLFKHSRHESPKAVYQLHSPSNKLQPLDRSKVPKLQDLCSKIAANYDVISSLPTYRKELPSLRLSTASSHAPTRGQQGKSTSTRHSGRLSRSSSYK